MIRALILFSISFVPAFGLSEQRAQEEFDVGSGARLVVEVDFGTIDLTRGAEKKIGVNAYRKIEGPNDAREKEYLAATPLLIRKEANTVTVSARCEHNKNWSWSGETKMLGRYNIHVPAETNVEVATGGGEISAAEISGSCHAETSGGNLKFTRLRGPLNANSAGGHVALEACDGAINVSTSGGKIDTLAGSGSLVATTAGGSIVVRNFNGDTRVETNGGALNLENIRGQLIAETAAGSISVLVPTPFPGDVRLETAAGRIEVALPPDAAVDVNAETSEGSVTSDLPMITKRAGREGLQGTINGGGKALVLRTGSGNIVIKSTAPGH